jgi:hypothetical protein
MWTKLGHRSQFRRLVPSPFFVSSLRDFARCESGKAQPMDQLSGLQIDTGGLFPALQLTSLRGVALVVRPGAVPQTLPSQSPSFLSRPLSQPASLGILPCSAEPRPKNDRTELLF